MPNSPASGGDDLRLISQLVDALSIAERPKANQARAMLDARPEPETVDECRDRARAIVAYVKH